MSEPEIILGISPGTHAMGIALFSNQELIDWKLRTFKGKWTASKGRHIVKTISLYLEKYQVAHLVLKIPNLHYSSIPALSVIRGIRQAAFHLDIPVYEYRVKELERHLSDEIKTKKRSIVEPVLKKYPELITDYKRIKRYVDSEFIKVYEAVAAVDLYSSRSNSNPNT